MVARQIEIALVVFTKLGLALEPIICFECKVKVVPYALKPCFMSGCFLFALGMVLSLTHNHSLALDTYISEQLCACLHSETNACVVGVAKSVSDRRGCSRRALLGT